MIKKVFTLESTDSGYTTKNLEYIDEQFLKQSLIRVPHNAECFIEMYANSGFAELAPIKEKFHELYTEFMEFLQIEDPHDSTLEKLQRVRLDLQLLMVPEVSYEIQVPVKSESSSESYVASMLNNAVKEETPKYTTETVTETSEQQYPFLLNYIPSDYYAVIFVESSVPNSVPIPQEKMDVEYLHSTLKPFIEYQQGEFFQLNRDYADMAFRYFLADQCRDIREQRRFEGFYHRQTKSGKIHIISADRITQNDVMSLISLYREGMVSGDYELKLSMNRYMTVRGLPEFKQIGKKISELTINCFKKEKELISKIETCPFEEILDLDLYEEFQQIEKPKIYIPLDTSSTSTATSKSTSKS